MSHVDNAGIVTARDGDNFAPSPATPRGCYTPVGSWGLRRDILEAFHLRFRGFVHNPQALLPLLVFSHT